MLPDIGWVLVAELLALGAVVGFLAGLLGVNLGGIPGASSWWGFSLFCLLLLAVFAMQLLYLKNKKWM